MTTYEKGKYPVDDLANTLQDERLPLREKKRILFRVHFPFAFTFTVAIKLEQNSRFYRLIP